MLGAIVGRECFEERSVSEKICAFLIVAVSIVGKKGEVALTAPVCCVADLPEICLVAKRIDEEKTSEVAGRMKALSGHCGITSREEGLAEFLELDGRVGDSESRGEVPKLDEDWELLAFVLTEGECFLVPAETLIKGDCLIDEPWRDWKVFVCNGGLLEGEELGIEAISSDAIGREVYLSANSTNDIGKAPNGKVMDLAVGYEGIA